MALPTLTCMACLLGFENQTVMREHYVSDWHRMNLKRKVALLPPLSSEEFEQREAAFKTAEEAGDELGSCKLCNKTFSSDGALKSHLGSKLHRKAVSQTTKPESDYVVHMKPAVKKPVAKAGKTISETMAVIQQADGESDVILGEALTVFDCLFCRHRAESLEENVAHMTKVHSFFIPDIEYLVDLAGLVEYLGEKVGVGHVCLYCNDKSRQYRSTEAVQMHMEQKSHCKIEYDPDHSDEFDDFYDFSSSYSNADSIASIGRRRKHFAKVKAVKPSSADNTNMEDIDEEEWSDVTDEEEGAATDDAQHRELIDPDAEITVEGGAALADNGYELILPDGTRAGHRSFQRYYKQKYRTPDTRDSVTVNKLLLEYKQLGWQTRQKQIQQTDISRMVDRQRVQKAQMDVGVSANKLRGPIRKTG
eukprot:TRINITY_DN5190_c0_g1_i1.p1 TRINITY_DN5190_c0_g1~~TRINITY_DN5190_c0_g1_i1.p1  ORF type:complete len:420 (-),score=88.37 TRINITY_DN5190_c0_g1_i1:498-1757(-)